jgi:hypothetical protein
VARETLHLVLRQPDDGHSSLLLELVTPAVQRLQTLNHQLAAEELESMQKDDLVRSAVEPPALVLASAGNRGSESQPGTLDFPGQHRRRSEGRVPLTNENDRPA